MVMKKGWSNYQHRPRLKSGVELGGGRAVERGSLDGQQVPRVDELERPVYPAHIFLMSVSHGLRPRKDKFQWRPLSCQPVPFTYCMKHAAHCALSLPCLTSEGGCVTPGGNAAFKVKHLE